MTTKLIAENLITADHFVSATEQEGQYWSIPEPDSGNTGSLTPIVSGEAADFDYSGTTTADGAAGKTTLIDSALSRFGDDFFIGATVIVAGETRTVSDFAQATGTVTVSVAFTSQVMNSTAYTLNLDSSTRDFRLEIVTAGDAGTATYKWSHDGGTTYFGRDNILAASWPVTGAIAATHNGQRGGLLYTEDETLIAFYEVSDTFYCKRSTDNGSTWGDAITVKTQADTRFCRAIQLTNARILVLLRTTSTSGYIQYSDDDGATWSALSMTGFPNVSIGDFCQLDNDDLILVTDDSAGSAHVYKSTDGGVTWGSAVDVTSNTNVKNYTGPLYPTTISKTAATGGCCVVWRNISSAYALQGRYSTDYGATWSADKTVASEASDTFEDFILFLDEDTGDVLCFAYNSTDTDLDLFYSTDDGSTWSAKVAISTSAYTYPCPASGTNHEVLLAAYLSGTGLCMFYRGFYTSYSSNAIITRTDGDLEQLICGAAIYWSGSGAIVGDKWSFSPAYEYAMENIIEDPPSIPWRSTQDNIACTILLDAGANARFRATGASFFGCNLRTLSFQMSADNSTWSVDETVTFDLTTGTIDSVSGNVIEDSSVFSTYKDHELAGLYFRATSGTDSGLTWQIEDNWGNYIILDTTAATNLANSNTFAIYQDHIAKTFTGGIYRYIRLSIAAQQCAENYYQIGTMRAASAITLSDTWQIGYAENFDLGYDLIKTGDGGLIAIDSIGGSPRTFELTFPVSDAGRLQVSHLLRQLRGRAICLIPDSATLTECYLVIAEPEIQQRNDFLDYFTMSIRLREIL